MPYEKRQNLGFFYSALLHALVFLLAIVGLPQFLSPPQLAEPLLVVDIESIADVSNVPIAEEDPVEKPEEKKEEKKEEPKPEPPKPEEKPSPKPVPKVVTEPPPPPPPPPEEKEVTEKKPEPLPKPEEKKPEEKKKPKEQDLSAILKSVKETAQKEEKKEASEKKPEDAAAKTSEIKSRDSPKYDPSLALSVSEKNAIRSQIARNWTVPAGARDAHELVIILYIELEQDGTVTKVELTSAQRGRYSQDSFFRAAADSAMRAVRRSSPLKNLAPEKYQSWRRIELAFDPKDLY